MPRILTRLRKRSSLILDSGSLIMDSSAKSDPVKLKVYRALVVGFLFLVTCGALSIPFVYESMTLWYKVGIDKTILRVGQMAGLLTAVLVFVQILLAARGKFFTQLFGIAALMRWHKANGIILSLLAISHVLLVLVPEGLTNVPIGPKYWPEMVGGLLLWIILSMVISSQFRQTWGLNYMRWRVTHKILGYFSLILLAVHVLFVSDSFEHIIPKMALVTSLVGVVVAVILSKKATK